MDVDPARQIVILPTDLDYLDQLVDVQRRAYDLPPEYYDHPDVITADKFRSHMRVFPQGQFMALNTETDEVVGTCASMIVDFDDSGPLLHSFRQTTDSGYLTTHNPNGNWLYGVDCVVVPEWRSKGVGGRLIQARYNVARKLNLRGMIAGSMIIDYHVAAAQGMSAEDYVAAVVAGTLWDTNLSKQLKKGFRVLNVIPNYLADSDRTLDYAAAILWENPDYRPVVAPKVALPKRPAAPAVNRPNLRPQQQ